MKDCKPVASWAKMMIQSLQIRGNIVQWLAAYYMWQQGTQEFGLWYPKGKDLSLMAYTDADWAGCIDDRRSTSGAAFYLGECLVLWLSKK